MNRVLIAGGTPLLGKRGRPYSRFPRQRGKQGGALAGPHSAEAAETPLDIAFALGPAAGAEYPTPLSNSG